MKEASFERGDRVRHKITQIEGEIVQIEESLAMPHAWVIEPSIYDVNPPRLYRIVDLEKVESRGKETNNQAQCANLNISRGKQQLEVDASTSKQFPDDKSIDKATISLSDRKPEGDTLTSKEFPCESVLIVENKTTTVCTEPESFVLTVEQELVTLRSESVSGEQIASKPLPITVRSSSTPGGNTSTSNELLRLRRERSAEREPVLTVESDTTTVSTMAESPVLTVESDTTTVSTEVGSFVLTAEPGTKHPGGDLRDLRHVENDSTQRLSDSTTQRSNKRRKGEGTGRIQLRTITKKNGKQYQQFWYDWQVHTTEKIIYKSVYIPKRLLEKIQELESAKAPIIEILKILNKTL